MQEADALTKACPFRLDGDDGVSYTMQFMLVKVPTERATMKWEKSDMIQESNRCIGSKCMAWQATGDVKGLCNLIHRG